MGTKHILEPTGVNDLKWKTFDKVWTHTSHKSEKKKLARYP